MLEREERASKLYKIMKVVTLFLKQYLRNKVRYYADKVVELRELQWWNVGASKRCEECHVQSAPKDPGPPPFWNLMKRNAKQDCGGQGSFWFDCVRTTANGCQTKANMLCKLRATNLVDNYPAIIDKQLLWHGEQPMRCHCTDCTSGIPSQRHHAAL